MESTLNFADLFANAQQGDADEMNMEARPIGQSEVSRAPETGQNHRRKATVKRSFSKAMKKAAEAA